MGVQPRSGTHTPVGELDTARDSADLQWDRPSPDAGQGRTVPSHSETHAGPSGDSRPLRRLESPPGRFPTGIQPAPASRVLVDGDASHPLPAQSPSLEPESPEWEYPPGTEVRRLNPQDALWLGRHYWVSRALGSQRVQLQRVDGRLLVIFRNMYVREIDLISGRSAMLICPVDSDAKV